MRSRTVSRPAACCRAMLSAPPMARAIASRRRISSISVCQLTPLHCTGKIAGGNETPGLGFSNLIHAAESNNGSPSKPMQRRKTEPVYTPAATYRLQFNHTFTFEQAAGLVDYLDELGITDLYASPFLMARPGSLHGYDVTDHSRFNPEIGDEDSFRHLSERIQQRGMGLIVDVVPNHMCISHPSNRWWWDVLENGPSSFFARFFDIEWHPPKAELANKVLLPVLGDQYGRVLENQEIRVIYADEELKVTFYETPLPLAPRTWNMILEPAVAKLRDKLDPSH